MAERWEDTYKKLLREVITSGSVVSPHRGESRELVAERFTLVNPLDRCLMNQIRAFNVFQAIGHWLWIMAGKMDLPSIQYYNKIAGKMSVDQRKLDGAYGPRLFGLGTFNQLPNLVQLIRDRPATRRAIATVYIPEFDSHRVVVEGREDEVPCTVGLQFLPRDDKLHAVTMMRSQDVPNVLPYDVFIFTLLHEYVAAEAGLGVGKYNHFASSFHVYSKDKAKVQEILLDSTPGGPLMPPMPMGSQAEYLRRVQRLEENIRNETDARLRVPGKTVFRPSQYLEEARELPEFWREVVLVLVGWAAFNLKSDTVLRSVHSEIAPAFKPYVERALALLSGPKALDKFGSPGKVQ